MWCSAVQYISVHALNALLNSLLSLHCVTCIALHCFSCGAVQWKLRSGRHSPLEWKLFVAYFVVILCDTQFDPTSNCISNKSLQLDRKSAAKFVKLSSVQHAVAFSSMKDCNAMALLLLLLKVFQIAREENAEHCTVQRLFRVRNNLSTGRSMQHTAFELKSRGPWSLVLF